MRWNTRLRSVSTQKTSPTQWAFEGPIMRRGEIYRVHKPEGDPKSFRSFVVVSRKALIDSAYSTVICAPIYTHGDGLITQVAVGADEGLLHDSWIACDNLRSLYKSDLTQFVGSLSYRKLNDLNRALRAALGLENVGGI
jgi:mRNA interferase MazF